MEAIRTFFEYLIIITAGLVVLLAWAFILVGGCIELYDAIFGDPTKPTDEDNPA